MGGYLSGESASGRQAPSLRTDSGSFELPKHYKSYSQESFHRHILSPPSFAG